MGNVPGFPTESEGNCVQFFLLGFTRVSAVFVEGVPLRRQTMSLFSLSDGWYDDAVDFPRGEPPPFVMCLFASEWSLVPYRHR